MTMLKAADDNNADEFNDDDKKTSLCQTERIPTGDHYIKTGYVSKVPLLFDRRRA
jgi:hypothetical protein